MKEAIRPALEEAQQSADRTSAYLARVYERERRQISHALHYDVGHGLILLKLNLEDILQELDKGRIQETRHQIEQSLALVSQGLRSIRRLAVDLGPALLDEVGLIPAVRIYGRQFSARTGINVTVEAGRLLLEEISPQQRVVLYRILQLALRDFAKQTKARNVKISFSCLGHSTLAMTVGHDGNATHLSARRSGVLTVLRERVGSLGGTLDIHSRGPKGARFEVRVPIEGILGAVASA
jgi:two-component system sensor histidine kinase UhpB